MSCVVGILVFEMYGEVGQSVTAHINVITTIDVCLGIYSYIHEIPFISKLLKLSKSTIA